MSSVEIVIPGNIPTGQPFETRTELESVNVQIESRIRRLLGIARKRGCPNMKREVASFVGRLKEHRSGDENQYDYLSDMFVRSMAIQGEEHLSPNNQLLTDLFNRRDVLVSQLDS